MANFIKAGVRELSIPAHAQTVLKTITIALQPFVPFTQQYTMEVSKSKMGPMDEGNFNIQPKEQRGGDPAWKDILGKYQGRTGNTVEDMVENTPQIDHLLPPLAKRLTELLEQLPKFAQPPRYSTKSVYGEIKGEFGVQVLKEMFDSGPSPMKKEYNEILSQSRKGFSTQAFDFARGKDTEALFQTLGTMFGESFIEDSAAVEVTDSKFKKEISTGQKGITDPKKAWAQMEKTIEDKYGKINTAFKEMYQALKPADKGDFQQILSAFYQSRTNSLDKAVLNARTANIGTGLEPLLNQFVDRFARLNAVNAAEGGVPKAYNYLLPLGDTGFMVGLKLGPDWTKGYPQMDVLEKHIVKVGGDAALLDLFRAFEQRKMGSINIFTEERIKDIEIQAANDYINSTTKGDFIEMSFAAILDSGVLDPAAAVDMFKPKHGDKMGKPTGAMKFTSSEIAALLAPQFQALKDDPAAGGAVADAWKKIYRLANKASELWKKKVTQNQIDYDYLGTQARGNQGVWTANGQNWPETAGSPTGYNVGMVPLTLSQAGPTARITTKNIGKVPMQVDDPSRGKMIGDSTRKGVALIGKTGKQGFSPEEFPSFIAR